MKKTQRLEKMMEIIPKLNPLDKEAEKLNLEKYRMPKIYEFERKWSKMEF